MNATNLPTVLDLAAAAALLGIRRMEASELVRDDAWPTPFIRLGKLTRGADPATAARPARGAGATDGVVGVNAVKDRHACVHGLDIAGDLAAAVQPAGR